MKKTAFTLAEVAIVLVLIGVLAAILLPVAFKSKPDENVIKFKRAYNTYTTALQELINSDKYYLNGDLSTRTNGNLIDYTNETDSAYFCESFSNFIHTKEKNCQNNLTAMDIVLPFFEDQKVHCTQLNWNESNPYSLVEALCNVSDKTSYSYVKDVNNVLYYYTPQNFNSARCVDEFGNSLVYEIHCIDIDGFDYGEDPFWLALRQDGRIVNSPRVQEWLDKLSVKAN